jgi:hypothetical protein
VGACCDLTAAPTTLDCVLPPTSTPLSALHISIFRCTESRGSSVTVMSQMQSGIGTLIVVILKAVRVSRSYMDRTHVHFQCRNTCPTRELLESRHHTRLYNSMAKNDGPRRYIVVVSTRNGMRRSASLFTRTRAMTSLSSRGWMHPHLLQRKMCLPANAKSKEGTICSSASMQTIPGSPL